MGDDTAEEEGITDVEGRVIGAAWELLVKGDRNAAGEFSSFRGASGMLAKGLPGSILIREGEDSAGGGWVGV